MLNNDLVFVKKEAGNSPTKNSIDVSLTLVNKMNGAALSFSPKASAMFGEADYITGARYKSRLYFLVADAVNGFKLSKGKKDCARRSATLPAKKLGIGGNWIGYYPLQWDRDRELFYIDLDKREG